MPATKTGNGVLPYTKDNPIFFTFNSPTSLTSSLWKHPNVRFIAKPFINGPDILGLKAVLSDLTTYPLPTGQLKEYAEASAETVFRFFAKQGLASGNGAYHNGAYDGAFYIQNWGSYTGVAGYDVCCLIGHPHDRIRDTTHVTRGVSGLSPALNRPAYGGITGTTNDYTFTISSGIAECTLYTEYFADYLKSKLDSSGMCYPKFCIWDLEDSIDARMIHNIMAVTGQVGNFRNAVLEPRFQTQYIMYDRAGTTGLTPVTYSGWWYNKVHPLINNNNDILDVANSGAFLRIVEGSSKNQEYGLYEALYKPLKQRFPEIICSNYCCVQITGTFPILIPASQSWYRYNQDVLLGDMSTFELYPFDYRTNTNYSQHNTNNLNPEDFTVITSSGRMESMYKGSLMGGGKQIAPWISTPLIGDAIGTSGLEYETWYQAYKKEVPMYILFNSSTSDSSTVNAVENYLVYLKNKASGIRGM